MDTELMISVIVPVYNGEAFMRRAADSVICQMDGQIELILVDDGSTDSSGAICDAYAAQHPHVRVVHKKNGGLSSARNAGIAVAQGKYLSFLDADDYVDTDTYANVIRVIKEHEPDFIDFGWKYVSQTGEVTENRHGVPKEKLLDASYIADVVLPPLLNLKKDDAHFIFDFAWNKVFKTEIVRENEVRFDETRRIWEDRPFSVIYLKYCNTFFSMNECFYNYLDVPNSLSRQYYLEFFDVILKNYNIYHSLYRDMFDFDTPYVKNYWSHSIQDKIFLSLAQTENTEQIRRNILDTLQNELVVDWFAGRETETAFDAVLSQCVANGDAAQALHLCEQQYKKTQRRTGYAAFTNRVKARIKKIIGR